MLKKKINTEIASDYEQLWAICQFENITTISSGKINTGIVMRKKINLSKGSVCYLKKYHLWLDNPLRLALFTALLLFHLGIMGKSKLA